ncbi:hypothetical protein PG987_006793 [Apiospora arundinis]
MGKGHEKEQDEPPVEVMAHIQAGASAQDDARNRLLAQAFLSFESSQVVEGTAPPNPRQPQSSSLGANTPANYPNLTGSIGPTHVGSMSTPPAAQGSAPTPPSGAQSLASRGFFASQPVLPTIEVPCTSRPLPWSQGDTPSHMGFSSPSVSSNMTPMPARGWDNRASTEVTHISETTRGGSTIIPETPQEQSAPPYSQQFVPPSSFTSTTSFGSSSVLGNGSPRPVDPEMACGPSLIYYPPGLNPDGSYETPPPGGKRPVESSDDEVSETPGSSHRAPGSSLPMQSSPLREVMNSSQQPRGSSPMQTDDDISLPSLPIDVPMQFLSFPPQFPDPMNTSSPSSGKNGGSIPPSSHRSDPVPFVIPNTSSQVSGGSSSQNSNLPPPSTGSFIPETSPFNASQFPPSSSQPPLYNPNLEIHGPAVPPSSQNSGGDGGLLVPPALGDLQTRLNHDGRSFQPARQNRALRPDERGYWVVDTLAWTPQQWLAAWAHLTEFVGGGAAGWSVSVRRDEDGATLRIYCFGAVVEHVWWLLFQVSEGRVVATGGRWLDASGTEVLQMGARPQ